MIINSIYRTIKENIEVRFKSPSAGEGEELLAYFKKLFEQSSQFLNYPSDHYSKQSAAFQESFIKNFSEDRHSFAIFAYIDNAVVGHIVIHNQGSERTQHRATLMMGVLEEWQNKGIGKLLLDLGIEESSKVSILCLELRVRDFNQPAIKLYNASGFTKIGIIEGAAKIDGVFVNEYIYVRNSQKLLSHLSTPVNAETTSEDYKKTIKFLESKIASLEIHINDMQKKID
jgi:RimJ/RimL family protein N-acetyltransferase